ncbi:MAG: hypothetical protein DME24_01265 [Verrucomicrobia bacterium]|nr:MAG: hypothetical protein DME24_01265 [Verrucomicrobiota bacterium]
MALVVVLPVPLTPTMETTVGPPDVLRSSPWFEERLVSTPQRQPAVGFLQTGFEFLKKTHSLNGLIVESLRR